MPEKQTTQTQVPKKNQLKTSTTLLIIGGIAIVIFFLLPTISLKSVKVDPVVTSQPAVTITAPGIPMPRPEPFSEINTTEVVIPSVGQPQITQQLEIIKQQTSVLQDSIKVLTDMIELREKLTAGSPVEASGK